MSCQRMAQGCGRRECTRGGALWAGSPAPRDANVPSPAGLRKQFGVLAHPVNGLSAVVVPALEACL